MIGATDRDVVICAPIRTPVGRYGGAFAGLTAAHLASTVVAGLLDRTGVPPEAIDDVVLGQCYPSGEAPAIGRVAALDAGWPVSVPGVQVDRRCGSGLQAVIDAALHVGAGSAEVVVAGGVESMSTVEHYTTGRRTGDDDAPLLDRLVRARETAGGWRHPVPGGMIETAENLRRDLGISREDQDRLAAESHRRAVAAQDAGRFAEELLPVAVPGPGCGALVDRDEHPRRDTTVEALARLRPVLGHLDEGATVTAGNASGQNDGAAACVVTHRARAEALGLQPLARIVSWAVAGVAPATMGIGPVPATERALARAELDLADIDLIELNEAFAAQVLACTRTWGLGEDDLDRVNVNGSGISLGHPVGATGARILATLVHEMHRRDARYGLETMCIGGGQGLAAVIERMDA